MNPQSSTLNPSSLTSRFTRRFLRALTKINKKTPTSSSPREAFQKYYRIKSAAEKSMACAVGSRRTWARAILFRVKNQRRKRRRANIVRRIKHRKMDLKRKSSIDQVEELRKVVPGCVSMDFCQLLEEAAHYIKCLNTQVQVMKCIVDSCSSS